MRLFFLELLNIVIFEEAEISVVYFLEGLWKKKTNTRVMVSGQNSFGLSSIAVNHYCKDLSSFF